MWLIPGKTKVKIELFKGVGIADVLIGVIAAGLIVLLCLSNIPGKYYIAGGLLLITIFILFRVDDEPNYILLLHMIQFLGYPRKFNKASGKGKAAGENIKKLMPYTSIEDGVINYGGEYYGAVIGIPDTEFRLLSRSRKNHTIMNGLGNVLRSVNPEYAANIVKIERPVHFEEYRTQEIEKLETLRKAYEAGSLSEEELKIRVEIVYDRIEELNTLIEDEKVVIPFYYLVLYEGDPRQLEGTVSNALNTLSNAEMKPYRLDSREIALFLRYTNDTAFDETELDVLDESQYAEWSMPDKVRMHVRTVETDGVVTVTQKVFDYPMMAGDAWLATVMTMPGTKVVVKSKPMDIAKAVTKIDRSLNELRAKLNTTGLESRQIELAQHIESLSNLLVTLKSDNETLLETNIYVTCYDAYATERTPGLQLPEGSALPHFNNMKKTVKNAYRENELRLMGNDFQQIKAFIAGQISGYDPFFRDGRGIPANSIAASYPWVFAAAKDPHGIKLGSSENVPVFIDFFRRDSERVNSNMVIVGKSGSGKSFATKSLLANLAADDAKIFVLDPENEYAELASNLHGKFINVGNANYGRLNPFHIITSLDDDESDTSTVSGSYSTHLQFLEEFFRQIMPDCDKDALEYLNTIVDRMYLERGITADSDLSLLKPEDYPIFDDLYDCVLQEFQETDNEYIRTMLRTLMNYISKFASGGRNANIWNGPSTIETHENFTVFNFQSLLANRNASIANAQMLLVLKYIDNEIISNRDYNLRYHANRKIVVVIDEAHVFIDTKFPIALDFMFQLAKRIRKYNGMQIVITQNIKDFVGSEEISRKSSAIINACQYSFIFALAPNDMDDLCKLYEKAGGINEVEQERIVQAQRGQAFTVLGPLERTSFQIEVPENVENIFSDPDHELSYFEGDEGDQNWEDYIGNSRAVRERALAEQAERHKAEENRIENERSSQVHFMEFSEEEVQRLMNEQDEELNENADSAAVMIEETEEETPEESAADTKTEADFLNSDSFDAKIRDYIRDEVERKMAALLFGAGITGVGAMGAAGAAAAAGRTAQTAAVPTPVQVEEDELFDEDEENENPVEVEEENLFEEEPEEEEEVAIAEETFDDDDDFDDDEEDSDEDDEMSGSVGEEFFDDEEDSEDGEDYSDEEESDGDDDSYEEESDEEDDSYEDDSDEEDDSDKSDSDEEDNLFDEDYGFGEDSDSEDSGRSEDSDSEEDDSYDLFGSDLWGLDDDDSSKDGSSSSGDSDGSDDGDMFDILSMLSEENEETEQVSAIDQMEIYDEKVIDISLDDLMTYIKNKKNRNN